MSSSRLKRDENSLGVAGRYVSANDSTSAAAGVNGSSKRPSYTGATSSSGANKTMVASAVKMVVASGSSSKPISNSNKKWVRLATVFAYVVAVSLAAVALAIYYSLMWKPAVIETSIAAAAAAGTTTVSPTVTMMTASTSPSTESASPLMSSASIAASEPLRTLTSTDAPVVLGSEQLGNASQGLVNRFYAPNSTYQRIGCNHPYISLSLKIVFC